jgi:hypothetical protein
MAVKVAEYFGQKTENNERLIQPVSTKENCPFMNDVCVKLAQGNKPVCSVRRNDGDLWIVCRHRLCATKNNIALTNYQNSVLFEVAKTVFGNDILEEDIAVRREETIPVVEKSKYHADYIMMNVGSRGKANGQKRVVLEMQGGGETSNTGSITRNIQAWELDENRNNEMLAKVVSASPIVTNAWRRQQEQFITKGNIAQQTGGGIVFCVGKPLYDYLWERVKNSNLNDLRNHNWTLAIIAFTEDDSTSSVELNYKVDQGRVLFTNYVTFVQTLINQGGPFPQMFEGEFELLNGDKHLTS